MAVDKAPDDAVAKYDDPACVLCSKCNVAKLELPIVDWITPEVPNETVVRVCQFAVDHGWAYKENADGTVLFICQRCFECKEESKTRLLQRFSSEDKCPKCGNADLGVKFCTGLEDCNFGAHRDHLHRTCRACTHRWIQGCLDDPNTFNRKSESCTAL